MQREGKGGLYFFFIVLHFTIPFGKFGLPYLAGRLQQLQEQRYPVLQVIAGSFRISVIHRTLTWTTDSLASIRDHSYACVYTQGVGHTDNESAQQF